ncbi:hypothetical protein ACQPZJ_28550 [Actinoplanes sp. CA-054009]
MTAIRERWPVLARALAVLLVGVLAYTGCDALMPGATGDAGRPMPGVTDDSVKVVFIGTDLGQTASLTGFKDPGTGDPEAQVKALEAYVNKRGGIAGRKMEAVYRNYEASNDSPAAETTLCSQITQDDRAYAVVLTGQLQSNARPCYAQRGTTMLDATLIANDKATFTELAPYLWTGSFPEYDAFAVSFLAVLEREGFFAERDKAGIVAADTPANQAVYRDIVTPALAGLGVTGTVSWIDTTDLGTLNTGLNQAAVNFRGEQIDRVFFLGGARIAPFFMTSAAAQNFTARYGVSTFDNPSFMVNNPATIPPAALKGMVGVGFAPAYDVPDSVLPFPSTDAEKNCLSIFEAAGIKFERRENARVAFTYCDAALLLQTAPPGEKLDAASFATATGFGGEPGASLYAAGRGYRVLKYAGTNFTYEGPVRPLGE